MHTFNTFTNSQQNDNLIAFKLLKELSGIAMYLLCKYKLQKFQLSPKRANINIHQIPDPDPMHTFNIFTNTQQSEQLGCTDGRTDAQW